MCCLYKMRSLPNKAMRKAVLEAPPLLTAISPEVIDIISQSVYFLRGKAQTMSEALHRRCYAQLAQILRGESQRYKIWEAEVHRDRLVFWIIDCDEQLRASGRSSYDVMCVVPLQPGIHLSLTGYLQSAIGITELCSDQRSRLRINVDSADEEDYAASIDPPPSVYKTKIELDVGKTRYRDTFCTLSRLETE